MSDQPRNEGLIMYSNNVTELHPATPDAASAFDEMFSDTQEALDTLTRDRKSEE